MGFYLLIAVVLLMTIFALRGGMGNQEKVTYAQVRQLLEQQMVSRVSLEDNTVTLYLKEPQGGQSVLTYQIGNPDWFYQDFNDLIVEQKRQGIITDYDYPQGWVPPYWMSFIPWIVILVVFGLLWYFMFLRQAGAGGGGGGGGGVDRTARFGRARTRTGADEQKKVTFEDGESLAISGVFVAVGVAGSTDLAKKLGAATEGNRILVDEKMATNVPGLYAAGDCTGGMLQIAKAVYQGAQAGTSIVAEIRKKK